MGLRQISCERIWGQFELAVPSVEKFLRKLEQTGLIGSGNGHGLYRMNGNCVVKGEGK